MILSLRLKNIALIKMAEIDFGSGLNVLSGETGAGKTVIISAINFALGGKFDKTMIRHGESSCEAELLFKVGENSDAVGILNEFGIEIENGEILIRRRLSIDGRNDVRVNGVSTTLAMLKKLTLSLCDVYGQSEHYSLLQKSNQLKVLDKYIGEKATILKDEIKAIIAEINALNKNPILNLGSEKDRLAKLDLLSYQINEIEKAELIDGEEEVLIQNRKILKNIEKIGENLQACKEILSGDNMSVDMISTACNKLNQLSEFGKEYEELNDRLYNVKAELNDISSEVENTLDNLEYDGNQLSIIEGRLDLIHNLQRKYGNTYSEIISFYENAKEEYDTIINADKVYNEITKKINELYNNLNHLYGELHNIRVDKSVEFSQKIKEELKTLGMKSANFNINIEKSNDDRILSNSGIDDIEFTFSANAGEPLSNMAKVISGGEMSRFMLAMKLLSHDSDCTYIFDEIDAGISGDVANIIAEKFSILSNKTQLITISHLAQIVSFADTSFKIQKFDDGISTTTEIIKLDRQGKVNEIVRIIGGGLNEISKKHAEQLVLNAENFKKENQ